MNTPKIMYKLTYGNALKSSYKRDIQEIRYEKRELDQFKHGQNEQGRKKDKNG